MKQLGIFLWVAVLALSSSAVEAEYVKDVMRVTVRSGPELTHRVIKELDSGREIDVVERGSAWSRIRMPDGMEGWMLSRFIVDEKPCRLRLEELEKEHGRLTARAGVMEGENTHLKAENQRLSKSLAENVNGLKALDQDYRKLKEGSAEYLALVARHKTTTTRLAEEEAKNSRLEDELRKRNVTLLGLGAGILFFGFIVGVMTRKTKRRASLL
jgi:SH3 domain protein